MEARLPCTALALAMLGTGCATIGPNATPSPAAKPNAVQSIDARGPNDELIPDDAALAAVENFLARTQDYQPGETASQPISGERSASSDIPSGATANNQPPANLAESSPSKVTAPVPAQPVAVANASAEITQNAAASQSPAVPTIQRVAIRSTQSPGETWPKPAENAESATNQPLALHGGTSDAPSEETVLEEVRNLLAGTSDFDSAWRWATVHAAIGGDELDAPQLSQEARNVHARLTALGDAVRDAVRDPFGPTGSALEEVEGLREALVERSDPAIGTIALCRKVATFGVYEPLPDTELVPGRAVAAIVYVEIGNLRADPTGDSGYRSALRTRLELFTESGESVWSREEPQIEDLCRRRRRDFFIAQRVSFPATIAAGNYVLKVYVEDRLSGRATESSQPLSIGGGSALARNGEPTQ